MSRPEPKEKKRSLASRGRGVACVATLTAAGLSFGLIACGGDESSATADQPAAQATSQALGDAGQAQGTAPPEAMPGPPMQLTAKQEECLAAEGVELPDPASASQGTPPDQGSLPDPEEMAAAFEACGIDAPQPPQGQGQSSGSAPPLETQTG